MADTAIDLILKKAFSAHLMRRGKLNKRAEQQPSFNLKVMEEGKKGFSSCRDTGNQLSVFIVSLGLELDMWIGR